MITSPDNQKLKLIRKLHQRKHREREGLFMAEGEDLVEAAAEAGVEPALVLVAGRDVEPDLLDAVSTLGSGTRAIGIYERRFSEPGGRLSAYLEGVADPGNVGAVVRSAHAFCDGPVALGPGCADPYSPKAVRASMGSVFARPPALADPSELVGAKVVLEPRGPTPLSEVASEPPLVVCLGAERTGPSPELAAVAGFRARIPMRDDGPESLNVAMAASIALHHLRMAARA